MKQKLFNQHNTEGYSDDQIDGLNTEWALIVQSKDLEGRYIDYYDQEAKEFSDEVSRR